MSVSREDQSTSNPISKFLSFNGRDAVFETKVTGETKERGDGKKSFVVLEDRIEAIKGYTEATGSYSSNMGRMQSGTIFRVKNFKDGRGAEIAHGKYTDIKESLPEKAKYTRVLYVYDPKDDAYMMFEVSGSQLWAYSEHLKSFGKNTAAGRVFTIKESEEHTNGAVTYYVPVFVSRELDLSKKAGSDLWDTIVKFDHDVLQPWLDSMISSSSRPQTETQPVNETNETPVSESSEDTGNMDDQDLPF